MVLKPGAPKTDGFLNVEPSTTEMPMLLPAGGGAGRDERLVVASRISSLLARAHSVEDVAGAGPLAEEVEDFLALEQPVEIGVNGRVARSGEPAMVNDTRLDSDYLHRNPRTHPRLGALATDSGRRLGLGGAQSRAGGTGRLRR